MYVLEESDFVGISCHPCGVELIAVELPIEDIGFGALRRRVRTIAAFALGNSGYPVDPHELRHAIHAARYADLSQVKEDPRTTIGAVALVPEVANLLDQPFVFLSSPR